MRIPAIALSCVLVLSACGGGSSSPKDLPSGDPGPGTRTTIGPDGGTVPLPGGGRLEVPPGALEREVEITAVVATAPSGLGFSPLGTFVGLEPAGLSFRIPAVITLPCGSCPAGSDRVEIVWSEDGHAFEGLDSTLDPTAMEIWAWVTHFSVGGPAEWDEEPVCCEPAEDGLRRVTRAWCQEVGGTVLGGPEVCRRVCCSHEGQGGTVALMLKADCDRLAAEHPAWGVWEGPATDCQGCCADDWTRKELSLCAHPAATEKECEVVCCSRGAGNPTAEPAGRCQELKGSVTGPLSSCMVCCSDGRTVALPDCPKPATDVADCDLVCCEMQGGVFQLEHRVVCRDAKGEVAGDSKMCIDEICCERSHTEEGKTTVTITEGDGADCLTLQAQHPKDTFTFTPADVVEGCVACCPDTWTVGRIRECPSAMGIPKSQCEPVCCRLEEGALPVPMPRGACGAEGGEEVAGDPAVCGCQEDADCLGRIEELGDCEVAACVDHECVAVRAPKDDLCEDGDFCTIGDHCNEFGTCLPGVQKICGTPPGIPSCYEAGYCQPESGECFYPLAEDAQCGNDGHCKDGKKCFGCRCLLPCQTDKDCPPVEENCRLPWCDGGACQPDGTQAPAGTECDDGWPCTYDDRCDPYGKCSGTEFAPGECPVCCYATWQVVDEKNCPGEKPYLLQLCNRVCCRIGEAYQFLSLGACLYQQGTEVPEEECPICEMDDDCWPKDTNTKDCIRWGAMPASAFRSPRSRAGSATTATCAHGRTSATARGRARGNPRSATTPRTKRRARTARGLVWRASASMR